MKYTITYHNPQNQYIKIKAVFNIAQNDSTTLNFPDWRPGRYQLGDFAKNVIQLKVYDKLNTPLKTKKTSKNTWQVDTNHSEIIFVEYLYYAAELNAGSTYIDEQQLYVNPVNCLVYIMDQQGLPCSLTLNIPKDFQIASGIPFVNNTLQTHDYHELVDTPFIASPSLTHFEYKIKDLNFHLWIQGAHQLNWEQVKKDFIKFTTAQLKAFGSFPAKQYHFLYQLTPYKTYHGVEHANSTVIALGPTYSIMHELYDDFLGVSSHELYHTWNIKNIRPKEMMPYDYSQPNYSNLGYVAEGVTTYMGDLFLSLSKVKTWNWYQAELEKLIQKHIDNFGRFNHSVAESSWDTWLDGYVKGVPNRKVSIYNEGALLAFITDINIRNESDNNLSLHDLMRELYVSFGEKEIGYTEEDYIQLVNKYTQEAIPNFFENFYYKANTYENLIVDALFKCGLELDTLPNPSAGSRMLGIKTQYINNETIISDIFPGSTAELAGLMIGDKLIAINQIQIQNNLDRWLEFYEFNNIQLSISRSERIIETTCPNTNRTYYPICAIRKVKIPSNLQKRIFKKWCGYKWDV
ncbi:M61 family peptidase [Putridiphycobacter roseus]|uniref:M61 family peptidase n=1 Tax=Putridiphycobacter roseus TaxID=2219161 RepID=A0A2W1N200_9FLAO|nr:M61 family metallopeptidase [Putridiphycobacter roseus]PZE17824.1 M61 family peptidase [Putridiphycobacter roseus]